MTGTLLTTNQYKRPAGYAVARLIAGSKSYKPFNGYVGGDVGYAPDTNTAETFTINFSAAPANGSSYAVGDGPPNAPATPTKNFVYTYSGSPGAGVIPLVAGGGTAAQAATATQVAMAAQLSNWTVTNPSAGVVVLVSKFRGVNPAMAPTGVTNSTLVTSLSAQGPVVPGRVGKVYCFFPAG